MKPPVLSPLVWAWRRVQPPSSRRPFQMAVDAHGCLRFDVLPLDRRWWLNLYPVEREALWLNLYPVEREALRPVIWYAPGWIAWLLRILPCVIVNRTQGEDPYEEGALYRFLLVLLVAPAWSFGATHMRSLVLRIGRRVWYYYDPDPFEEAPRLIEGVW